MDADPGSRNFNINCVTHSADAYAGVYSAA